MAGNPQVRSQKAGHLSKWQSSVLTKASFPPFLSSGSGHQSVLPLGQKAVLYPSLPAVCTLAMPKPPSHLSHPGSQEWSWKEPGGCLDSSGFSLLLWLAPCCISQSPCSNVSTSWRPQTRMGLNCSQLVTSSASGRLESHTVNSFKFHPLCISFSVSSPTLPSFTLISCKSTPRLCLPPPVSPISLSQLYFALQEDGFIHP